METRIQLEDRLLERCAALLAESYWEDPGVKVQLRGVADGRSLFLEQCRSQVRVFAQLGGLSVLGDVEAVALGYFTGEGERLADLSQQEMARLLEAVPLQSLQAAQENSAPLMETAPADWYRAHLGAEREVYVLQAIAVRKDLRGTGRFRKLLMPVLDRAAERGCPVVLQTFTMENAEKYRHMGFSLMGQTRAEALELTCYDMMRA